MSELTARDRDGIARAASLDNSTRALVTVTDAERAIHEGDHYFLKTWFDVQGKGTVVDFLFLTPSMPWRIHGNGRVLCEKTEFTFGFYEDVIVSNVGTPVPSVNNDRASEKISRMPVWANPTITDIGHDIWPAKVGVAGQAVTTGFNYEYFTKPDTYYMTRLTKDKTGTHWIDLDFWWYEAIHKDATYD